MRSDRPETFFINGAEITPRQLAEARQDLARKSPFNIDLIPAWGGLSEHEQNMSELDAQNYLIALADLVPGATRSYACKCPAGLCQCEHSKGGADRG